MYGDPAAGRDSSTLAEIIFTSFWFIKFEDKIKFKRIFYFLILLILLHCLNRFALSFSKGKISELNNLRKQSNCNYTKLFFNDLLKKPNKIDAVEMDWWLVSAFRMYSNDVRSNIIGHHKSMPSNTDLT